MTKLLGKTKLVKQILQEVPRTRTNDGYLILEYYKRVGIDTNQSFKQLILSGDIKDLESITRARRKVQEQFPDLKDTFIAQLRSQQKEKYVDFAMNANRNIINR